MAKFKRFRCVCLEWRSELKKSSQPIEPIAENLTGADFMLSFIVQSALKMLKCGDKYPHIASYIKNLESLKSYQNALRIEES